MAQQTLSLIIAAIDRATGPINKIKQSINGLGGGAAKASQQAGGLSNAIAFGMVKAQAAISGVTMGYNALTGALRESANSELEIMNAASGIAALAGIEFDQASKFVDKFESKLAKTVERLPGATSSYITLSRAISDNVATAFQDANGKIVDMDAYAAGLERMSSAAGFLGASANLPQELTNIAISNAMGGMSEKELRQLAFFQRNPAVLAGLDRTLGTYAKKLGKANLKLSELDPASRFKVLVETMEELAGPEQQQRAGKSVKGIFEGLRSSLFDSKGGLFGLERDLNSALDGTQNAYQRYGALIGSIFGVGGVLETLAKPLERMGFSTGGARDPMQILANGFEWLDERAKSLTKWLDKAQATIPNLSLDNIGEQFDRFVAFAQGRILAVLKSDALDNVGEAIAMGINGITGAIVAVVGGPESTSIVGQAFTVLIREFADVLANLSWESWAGIGAALLGPVIVGAAVKGLGLMLTKAIGTALLAAVMSPAFGAAATGIMTAVTGFFSAIAALPAGLVIVAAALTLASIRVFVTRWDEISAMFSEIGRAFLGAGQIALGILTLNTDMIRQGMQNLVDGTMGWFTQLSDAWAIMTGGETSATKSAIAAGEAADARIRAGGGRINPDGSVTGPIAKPSFDGYIPNAASGPRAKPSFDGYIPNAASGFMGLLTAAARERRAMPAGANLLVANTSETVLTREQAGAVGGALASKGSGNTFNISMTVNGAGESPDTLAQRVVNLLQIQLDEHLQGSLI
jgi:hypothetical protein